MELKTMGKNLSSKRNVLFLCTANYYRSRIAEILFNRTAKESGLNWCAESMGIAIDIGPRESSNISKHAVDGLKAKGIDIELSVKPPVQAREIDIAKADLVLALDEEEHKQLIGTKFPQWIHKIEYWNVKDLDKQSVEETILEISAEVNRLIHRLSYDSQSSQDQS